MSFLRVVARAAPVRPFVQVQAPRLALQLLARARLPPRAFFAAAAGGLRKEEIEARILDIVKGFEKVEPGKVSRKQSNSLVRQQILHRMFWQVSQSLTLYFSL
jgi:NADH dehydrogenase (ubiquinone) 1 alpha/beta subcomplex 1